MTDSLAPLRAAIRRRGHERDSQRSGPTRTPPLPDGARDAPPRQFIRRGGASDSRPDPHAGRIGPNAVIRLAEAAQAMLGPGAAAAVFEAAGLAHRLDAPPEAMVEEGEVVALYAALATLAPEQAGAVSAEAGHLTADYLLAWRIPRPVQWLLRRLPPRLAARILLGAIGGHAWTFAGSGRFSASAGAAANVSVEGGPFAEPGAAREPLAAYYAAVFERLFRMLVSPAARAQAALDGSTCRIRLAWRREGAGRPLPKDAQPG